MVIGDAWRPEGLLGFHDRFPSDLFIIYCKSCSPFYQYALDILQIRGIRIIIYSNSDLFVEEKGGLLILLYKSLMVLSDTTAN